MREMGTATTQMDGAINGSAEWDAGALGGPKEVYSWSVRVDEEGENMVGVNA